MLLLPAQPPSHGVAAADVMQRGRSRSMLLCRATGSVARVAYEQQACTASSRAAHVAGRPPPAHANEPYGCELSRTFQIWLCKAHTAGMMNTASEVAWVFTKLAVHSPDNRT